MKKLLLSISLLFFVFNSSSYAQPQWKFHLAFEDATGARDTIWLIWDATATYNVDTQFNEQAQTINHSVFNVFTGNIDGDTTKTQALPSSHNSNDVILQAMNCQFPLTISWDTALFHLPTLPQPVSYANMSDNVCFPMVDNCCGIDMLTDNQIVIDASCGNNFFPLYVSIHKNAPLAVYENTLNKTNTVFPNPCDDIIMIKTNQKIKECTLFDNIGRIVLQETFDTNYTLFVNTIPSGFYNLKITNQNNKTYYEKVIISH